MDTIGVSQTDFLSGEISMTFDLEKARDAAKFDDRMAITMFPLAIAEIERLRAEISEQKGMIWKTQQVKKEQAAQIKELEDALVEGLTNFLHYRASCYDPARRCPYAKECDDCSTWDACGHVEKFRSEARQLLQAEGKIRPDDSKKISHLRPYEVVAADLAGMLAKSWQITDERKAALAAMCNLSETISCPDCGVWIGFADIGPHMAVLRGMLEESQ